MERSHILASQKYAYLHLNDIFQKTNLLGFRKENVSFIDFFGVFIELWIISTILAIPSYLKITR